jgi:hypothetical protein
MTSLSQLRAQLEYHFAPKACECTLTGDHSLTVKLYNPLSGEVDLVISGLSLTTLATPNAVQALVEELRYELESSGLHRSDAVR